MRRGVLSYSLGAQLAERSSENRKAAGSTPVGTTEPSRSFYIAGVLQFNGLGEDATVDPFLNTSGARRAPQSCFAPEVFLTLGRRPVAAMRCDVDDVAT